MKKTLAALFLTSVFLTACGGSSAPAKTSDKLLDNDIFTQATSTGNIVRCKDILDKTLKDSCEQIINDQIATSAAVSALDKALCKKVSDERYRKECETQVDVRIEAKNAEAKRVSVTQSALAKKDPSICDQISDVNQKASCKYNMVEAEASLKKDPSICEKIGLKEMIDQCKSFLKK